MKHWMIRAGQWRWYWSLPTISMGFALSSWEHGELMWVTFAALIVAHLTFTITWNHCLIRWKGTDA